MSWNRLYTPGKNIGTIAEIYLNEDKTLIKKIYKTMVGVLSTPKTLKE